jgi:hypothetical protein
VWPRQGRMQFGDTADSKSALRAEERLKKRHAGQD